MTQKPDSSPAPSPEPTEETWDADAERYYENGEMNVTEARIKSGLSPVGQGAGEIATEGRTKLELVTDDHKPLPSAKREPKLRRPRRARTAREKRVADQAPPHQRVTPLGHDPILTSHPGSRDKAN